MIEEWRRNWKPPSGDADLRVLLPLLSSYNLTSACFIGVLVKKATSHIAFMLLALTLSLPALGQDANSAQRASQKSSEKYMKQQRKQQKKAEKEQKKATKKWNKQHHVG